MNTNTNAGHTHSAEYNAMLIEVLRPKAAEDYRRVAPLKVADNSYAATLIRDVGFKLRAILHDNVRRDVRFDSSNPDRYWGACADLAVSLEELNEAVPFDEDLAIIKTVAIREGLLSFNRPTKHTAHEEVKKGLLAAVRYLKPALMKQQSLGW